MLLKIAWRNLWRNRRRTLITAASVFLAVLLAISMRSLQEGVYEKMIENMARFYTGFAQVHQAGYWEEPSLDNTLELTPELEQAILKTPGITGAVPRLESFALAASDSTSAGVRVMGIDPERENEITNLKEKVKQGTFLATADRGVMVGRGLADKLGLSIGDTLVLIGQGYQGYNAAGVFPIQAILEFSLEEMNKGVVYLALPAAQEMYVCEGRATSYVLQTSNPDQTIAGLPALAAEIGESYDVMSWEQLMPEIGQFIEADRAGNIPVLATLYLIIGFGIFGTVIMLTAERKHEYGVLVAIGMKKGRINRMLVFETVLISMIGVLVGYAISLPIVLYFQSNPILLTGEMAEVYATFGMEPVMPMKFVPSIFLNQSLVIFILSVVVVLYPLWKIRTLKPVEAMRS